MRDEVNDCELGLFPNYSVIRWDRCTVINNDIRGGGVLISVKNHFNCSQITINNNNIEKIFVKLIIGSTILLTAAVYIPLHSYVNVYNNHTDIVNSLQFQYNNAKIILLGDYNLPTIQWSLFSEPTITHYEKIESDAISKFFLFSI